MTRLEFQEIKAYHAVCRRRRAFRDLTPIERRLVEKWEGVDVLAVLIEAFENFSTVSDVRRSLALPSIHILEFYQ